MKINLADLQRTVDFLNRNTGAPETPYTGSGADIRPNPGHYLIDSAYGGWALHQITENGGHRDVLEVGHVPKRELYNLIHAYRAGRWDALNKG